MLNSFTPIRSIGDICSFYCKRKPKKKEKNKKIKRSLYKIHMNESMRNPSVGKLN